MSAELTVQEAALAWAQGKRVEASPKQKEAWVGIRPFSSPFSSYSPDVLLDLSFKFRLAQEPPAKKFRPWTPEEVPVGVKMREKECVGWFTPTCAGQGEIETLINGSVERVSLKDLFKNHEHSLDNGKTWLPCGVEVSE